SLFEQVPTWKGGQFGNVPGYGQFVPYLDVQGGNGLGFNLAANGSFLGSNTGLKMVTSYARLRRMDPSGYMMELRGGWFPPRSTFGLAGFDGQTRAGAALFVGKQWKSGAGAGIAFEQTLGDPFRVGARLSMPTSAVTQAFGNFLGQVHSGGPGFSAQIPIARLNLGEMAT